MQFYLPPTCLSTNGMSHTCFCHLSQSWSSFTDPGGMERWIGLGTTKVSKQSAQYRCVMEITVISFSDHHASTRNAAELMISRTESRDTNWATESPNTLGLFCHHYRTSSTATFACPIANVACLSTRAVRSTLVLLPVQHTNKLLTRLYDGFRNFCIWPRFSKFCNWFQTKIIFKGYTFSACFSQNQKCSCHYHSLLENTWKAWSTVWNLCEDSQQTQKSILVLSQL